MNYEGPNTALLLQVLRDAKGELVSSRELKEKVGDYWREALAALKAEGYAVDEVLGGSGNRSFRLNLDVPPPKSMYRAEIAPLSSAPTSAGLQGKTVRVSLAADDIRALLRGNVTPTARDALVGGLMRLTDGD